MAWRPSSVQNRPFLGAFSATQPHKGNRIIDEIWWTRWDSNPRPKLGKRCFKSNYLAHPRLRLLSFCGRVHFLGDAQRRQHECDGAKRSEEHTSELQSRGHLVCRLLLE